jgi:serine protease inhibitor
MGLRCLGIPDMRKPPPVFRADHPFLFAIVDAGSAAILFLGRLVDPTRGM